MGELHNVRVKNASLRQEVTQLKRENEMLKDRLEEFKGKIEKRENERVFV